MQKRKLSGLFVLAATCTALAPFGAAAQADRVNPYTGNAAAIAQGENLFVTKACSGCHGAGGGGGMGPPVINDIWVYGKDDATLFDLITLGSVGYRALGHERKGRESIVGDMPAMGVVATEEEIWKLIAFIRSREKVE